jgi:hypothetical protein
VPSPLPAIYFLTVNNQVLGVELYTFFLFAPHYREQRQKSIAITTVLLRSPLKQSRRTRTIKGLLIGKRFTFSLGLLNDPNSTPSMAPCVMPCGRPSAQSLTYPVPLSTVLPLTSVMDCPPS